MSFSLEPLRTLPDSWLGLDLDGYTPAVASLAGPIALLPLPQQSTRAAPRQRRSTTHGARALARRSSYDNWERRERPRTMALLRLLDGSCRPIANVPWYDAAAPGGVHWLWTRSGERLFVVLIDGRVLRFGLDGSFRDAASFLDTEESGSDSDGDDDGTGLTPVRGETGLAPGAPRPRGATSIGTAADEAAWWASAAATTAAPHVARAPEVICHCARWSNSRGLCVLTNRGRLLALGADQLSDEEAVTSASAPRIRTFADCTAVWERLRLITPDGSLADDAVGGFATIDASISSSGRLTAVLLLPCDTRGGAGTGRRCSVSGAAPSTTERNQMKSEGGVVRGGVGTAAEAHHALLYVDSKKFKLHEETIFIPPVPIIPATHASTKRSPPQLPRRSSMTMAGPLPPSLPSRSGLAQVVEEDSDTASALPGPPSLPRRSHPSRRASASSPALLRAAVEELQATGDTVAPSRRKLKKITKLGDVVKLKTKVKELRTRVKDRKLERARAEQKVRVVAVQAAILERSEADTERAQQVLGETMAHASQLLASGAISTEEFAVLVSQSEENFGKQVCVHYKYS